MSFRVRLDYMEIRLTLGEEGNGDGSIFHFPNPLSFLIASYHISLLRFLSHLVTAHRVKGKKQRAKEQRAESKREKIVEKRAWSKEMRVSLQALIIFNFPVF